MNKMIRQSTIEMMFYYTLFVFLIFANITSAASEEIDEGKQRRGGTVGLFAFPRVGRGDPDMNMNEWDSESIQNSIEDYDIPLTEIKRQYLVQFPRTGRSNGGMRYWPKSVLKNMIKRGGSPATSGGLWFGPRLGRVQKRSSDKDANQENNKIHVYNPRLGRDSEEISDEYDNYSDSLPSGKTILLNNQFS